MQINLLFNICTDRLNLEVFLKTQEEMFGFPDNHPEEPMYVTVTAEKVSFVTESGKSYDLGTFSSLHSNIVIDYVCVRLFDCN